MYYQGILIGVISFLTIGLFHPIVIKTEYYIGKKAWPAFLAAGILMTVGALFIPSTFWSAVVSVVAFSCFWSIKELFEQEKRVKKGWFPKNPKKKSKDTELTDEKKNESVLESSEAKAESDPQESETV